MVTVRKLLSYPEELGFLTTHSGAEFGRGRSSDLCTLSASLAARASPVRTLKNRRWYERRRTGDVELSHFQLPVRYDAHGSGPETERAWGRLSSSCMTVLTGMECQASWEIMNISFSFTDTNWSSVAHLQKLFHSLTKPVGRHKILSISTPSLLLHLTGWRHVSGIIYRETYGPCCTVSDLI